ncbi:LLM class flavin-dependent oxidoreductase [Dactylosporangium fulvum]|uniref:LLM class flavin-dependent oxidoreductase n=1 Tax=Dactylosporangium fulvum TaxID=53359 RepID=UPI0031DAB435
MSAPPQLHLAVELDGVAELVPALVAAVERAEAAGFALVTLDDGPLPPPSGTRIEAGVRAAYLSRRTTRVGLAPALPVTTTEPFHVATQLASLDHASQGRAAWVVTAPNGAGELATVGRTPLADADLRRQTDDVVDVARRLWDSWEDDAVVRDVAAGRYLDADRVHHVHFEGASFTVTGPLITPRPPQGQVVVLAADTLGVTGRADVALVGADVSTTLADRVARARAEGAPLVFAEVDAAFTGAGPVTAERLRPGGSVAALRTLLADLAGVVDGVRLHPATPEDFAVLATQIAPGRPVDGPTLRDTLGLPRPVSVYAQSA